MQTRIGSFVESWANIAVGFSINWTANVCLLPILYDPSHPARSAFVIGCCFTVISQIRTYTIRRLFNGLRFGNREAKA
jgi:hypothetical protein